MSEVSLLVTVAALDYLAEGRQSERQIAVQSCSPDLRDDLTRINGKNRRELIIGGCIALVMGDTGAIWRAHNKDRLEDFDALFGLLARRPDKEMRIICELA